VEVESETMMQLADLVVQRTVALTQIPAPTGEEADRAKEVARWWAGDGVTEVTTDEVGNIWGCAVEGDGPIVIVAAHLDTVFSRDVNHVAHRDDSRLYGPGVGDNTVAVAALSVVGRLLVDSSVRQPVWLVGTVGEEGLGNLRGANWALDHARSQVSAFIALEGNYLGRIGTIGVGSVRWNVEVKGPGGHAWEAASAPSAIDMAARIVAGLGDVAVEPGRRSVNVGKFSGGEAINARARRASFDVDIRAVEPDELGSLVAQCRRIISVPSPEGMSVEIHEIGDRPAGAIDEQHPLVIAARMALERAGLSPVMVASSTDANAAHCRGVPGVALGVAFGGGEHTTVEWIDLDSIAVGLRVLTDTVVDYASEVENVRP